MRSGTGNGVIFASLLATALALSVLLGAATPAWASDITSLTSSAEAGDAGAALALGTAYDIGEGVAADPRAALHWYEVAARGGNVPAMFNVGVMYDSGTGTARNRAAAARWYRKAAERGHARAAYDLGLLYEEGEGVHRNLETAAHWYRRADKDGLTAGHLKLAALEPMLRARTADADYLRAQALIEQRGLAEAGPEMLSLLRRAADRGVKVAQYDLGYLYENGLGVETDQVTAYIWYRRAARSGTGADATVRQAATDGAARLAARLDVAQKATAAQALRTAER